MMAGFDPRVWLFWWVVTSTVALHSKQEGVFLVVVAVILASWVYAGKAGEFLRFSRVLVPMMLFVFGLQHISGNSDQALVTTGRMFSLLVSSKLVLSMGTTSFVSGIRNLRHPRLPALEKPIEFFASMLGQGLLFIDTVARELAQLKEVMRTRGIDADRGNPFDRAKKSMAMALPLFDRILDNNRSTGIAAEMLGYDMLAKRSVYRQLSLALRDKVAILSLLAMFALAFMLRL